MKKAQEQGIQTAKLPIASFMKMSSSQVLTVNQVVEILLKFLETRDWKTSFFAVILKGKDFKLIQKEMQKIQLRKNVNKKMIKWQVKRNVLRRSLLTVRKLGIVTVTGLKYSPKPVDLLLAASHALSILT
ncbi:tRNA methyltransferase TRM10-type domain [Sesbania bispinosa]|nr:tRNA methyltransferase TRM10-type domain [Sesbania bispinosa]